MAVQCTGLTFTPMDSINVTGTNNSLTINDTTGQSANGVPAGVVVNGVQTDTVTATGTIGSLVSAGTKQVDTITMGTSTAPVQQSNTYAFGAGNAGSKVQTFTYGSSNGSFVTSTTDTTQATNFAAAVNSVAGSTVAIVGNAAVHTIVVTAGANGTGYLTSTDAITAVVGQAISGTGIASGTTVTSVSADGKTIGLSGTQSAASSATVTVTVGGGAAGVTVLAPVAGTVSPSIAFGADVDVGTGKSSVPTATLTVANGPTHVVNFTYNGIAGSYTQTGNVGTDAAALKDAIASIAGSAVNVSSTGTSSTGSVTLQAATAGTALGNLSFSAGANATAANVPTWAVTTPNGAAATSAVVYDVSGFTGLNTFNGNSVGGQNIKVASTTAANLTDTTGGITLAGGKSQTVTAKGAINLTGSVGAITATNNDTGSSTTTITEGTNVTVTTKGTGAVAVGVAAPSVANGANPTGTVNVTAAKNAPVTVYGGTNVTVASSGGAIQVGGTNATNVAPTGTVNVTSNSNAGATAGAVAVYGGNGVTVNTAGGLSGAGASNTVGAYSSTANRVAAGAVVINDTNSTVTGNADTFTVKGGTTVNINTTATSGAIAVGAAAAVNAAGTGLNAETLASNPTGNVTIVNGTSTKYGTSTTSVYTNGATTVSVLGSGNTTIADSQATLATAGSNVGKAVGTSTLSSISLQGLSGNGTLVSDALTSLSLTDVGNASASMTITVTNNTAGHTLNLTLNNAQLNGSYYTTVTDNVATAMTVGSAGTAANYIALTGTKLNTVTFNNATALTLQVLSMATPTTLLKDNIVANNSGSLTLGDLTGAVDGSSGYLNSINAAGATGNVSVYIDSSKTSYTGGAGNDTVTIKTGGNAPTKAITGGSGSDTIIVNYASSASLDGSLVSGFETLGMGALANGNFDSTGFTNLSVANTLTGDSTFSNVSANANLSISAFTAGTSSTQKSVTVTLADATGASDVLNIALGKAGTATTGANVGNSSKNMLVTASGVETINVNSVGVVNGSTIGTNYLTLTDTSAKAVVITGNNGLTMSLSSAPVATIDASGSTGGAIDVTGIALKTTGATITGGAGVLTAKGGVTTTANDVITVGSGGGVVTSGLGGSAASSSGYTSAWTAGSETINLGASAVRDTVKIVNAVSGSNDAASLYTKVNGFNVANSGTNGDALNFVAATTATAKKVLATNATPVTAASGVQSYTVANGIITFTPIAANVPTLTQMITDAQAAVAVGAGSSGNDAIAAAKNNIAAFVYNGDTYVVTSGNTTQSATGTGPYTAKADSADVTILRGTVLTTVGNLAAAGSAVVSSGVTYTAKADTASFTNNAQSLDLTGYNAETLTVAGTNGAVQATTLTINNLASAGQLNLTAGTANYHLGNIVVNQTGAAGANSLAVVFDTTAGIVDNLTVNGNWAVSVSNSDSSTRTGVITNLVDGSAGQVLTNVYVTGSKAVTLGQISGTGLTTIDASSATGAVVLGSAVGSGTGPLANAGITVKAAVGGANTAYLSGAADTLLLNVASSSGVAGGSYYLSGANDTVSATVAGTLNNALAIYGTGSGLNINLSNVTSGSSKGVLISGATSTDAVGANAVISLGAGISGADQKVIAGVNTVVYGGNAYELIDVVNATWGTTSNMTTLQLGVDTSGTALTSFSSTGLKFTGTATGAMTNVNVSGAASLNAALAIADTVAEGIGADALTWFQFGGNTYVLQNEASGVAGPDATDIVVQIVGIHDVTTNVSSGVVTVTG